VNRRSLFEELNEFAPVANNEKIVENRANHVISSAINLIEFIETHYTQDEALNLHRRLISSIKGKDPKRFSRALTKINEGKE